MPTLRWLSQRGTEHNGAGSTISQLRKFAVWRFGIVTRVFARLNQSFLKSKLHLAADPLSFSIVDHRLSHE
jgi:hypothetical protein